MTTDKIVRDIISQFKKSELLEISKELEISVAGTETTRLLAAMIIEDMEQNGIPESGDVSDSLYELLIVAEYIDEDGNALDGEVVESEQFEEDIPDWICFSYADPRDPACQKCKLYDLCTKKRLESRPSCFGKLYSSTEPECEVCIESIMCEKESNKNG
jgi:hypothetical protein